MNSKLLWHFGLGTNLLLSQLSFVATVVTANPSVIGCWLWISSDKNDTNRIYFYPDNTYSFKSESIFPEPRAGRDYFEFEVSGTWYLEAYNVVTEENGTISIFKQTSPHSLQAGGKTFFRC